METTTAPSRIADRARPGAARILGVGFAAAVVSVGLNLAVRAVVLAALDGDAAPFPLALGADVIFTFVPSLFGIAFYLVLRRTGRRPVRWFAFTAAVVVVLSWIGPVVLASAGTVTVPVAAALFAMHAIPAGVLVAAFRRIDRR